MYLPNHRLDFFRQKFNILFALVNGSSTKISMFFYFRNWKMIGRKYEKKSNNGWDFSFCSPFCPILLVGIFVLETSSEILPPNEKYSISAFFPAIQKLVGQIRQTVEVVCISVSPDWSAQFFRQVVSRQLSTQKGALLKNSSSYHPSDVDKIRWKFLKFAFGRGFQTHF